MSAQTILSSANAASSTPAVVLHDNATNAQGVSATYAFLDQLVMERESWEVNAFRTSNEQLYVLLQKCYQFYKSISEATPEGAALRKGLIDYINLKGYKFAKATHTLAKIIKCAYSIALKLALDKNIQVFDIPQFIRDAGGVEELRLEKSEGQASVKQKVNAAATQVSSSILGIASGIQLASKLDGGKIGTQVILIGTWQADGTVTVGAIVESCSVLNAALSSFYGANKKQFETSAKERSAANDASLSNTAITDAAHQAA